MQSLSPTSRYLQALNEGTHQPDDVQKEAVDRLETLYQALTAKKSSATPPGGLIARLGKLLGKNEPDAQIPVRGLYMWGGVGRGKTWLMDLFYHSLPGERKLRLHFHRFMLRVHEELTALQGQIDPLDIIADRFKTETDVLCFDEFFVTDITDAMLLGGLMKRCLHAALRWSRPPIFRRMNSTATVCNAPASCQLSMPLNSTATL
ncbi:ATP/GTP-binding protein [Salmonella enterica subsp. enterica]|uniref:ATP/GTP-binding protein n=1 Tax=Salmonella enterica I TaxID=59201 RepID=A0A379W1V0_SALET|nr:ATP/GTP-binding protein [Salmonella enterica subsp. enterica]